MDKADIQKAEKYYVRHLKEVILPFWIPDCIDRKFGGYLNCYDNTGKELLSYNKDVYKRQLLSRCFKGDRRLSLG